MSSSLPGRRSVVTIVTAIAALLALLTLASCSSTPETKDVTVHIGSTSITLPTALSCSTTANDSGMICSGGENDDHAPHVSLAPGTPLTVDVPKEVGDTPWVIVFAYVDSSGTKQSDRTAVFPPKERYSYQLTPPKGAQMTRLEVQSLYATPGADGGIEFPAVHTWVLVIDPVGTGS